MNLGSPRRPILLAEDDDGDRLFIRKALEKNGVSNPLVTVENGEDLLDYLRAEGPAPGPCFILLDLNMPRMDGREALSFLKSNENLKRIPVVILTTSKAEEDIVRCYELGANSYITKPVDFDGLTRVVRSLKKYWLETVDLPEK